MSNTSEKIAASATWTALGRVGAVMGGLMAPVAIGMVAYAADAMVDIKIEQASQSSDIASIDSNVKDMRDELRRLQDWVRDISQQKSAP